MNKNHLYPLLIFHLKAPKSHVESDQYLPRGRVRGSYDLRAGEG